MKYFRNDIVKPFKVKILCYAKQVHEMHDLAEYLPPPLLKVDSTMESNCSLLNKEFTTSDIQLDIKEGPSKSIRGELDDHQEDYFSLTY